MPDILKENDKLKERLIAELLEKAPGIERAVLEDLFRVLDRFDTIGGNFTDEMLTSAQLLEINETLTQSLARSGYTDTARIFINDLSKVSINTGIILSEQGFNFDRLPLSSMEKKWKSVTATSLLDSGLNENFKRPVLKILDDAISYGNSVEATKQRLSEFIGGAADKKSGGKLASYLTTTARDAIGGMQGQQMQSVANAIGYDAVLYTGGLLADSRCQCVRWVRELKGVIPADKLQSEIDLAYKNQAAKKVEGTHKWGGMMPDTTVSNFFVKRGGWGCLHTATPRRKK